MGTSVPKEMTQAGQTRRSPVLGKNSKAGPAMGAASAVGAIGFGDCRWPFGDPRDDNFHFCCAKTPEGAIYCTEHSALARTVMNRR